HDWGAALAWALATFRPDTVDHLVVLSVGHPATFRRTPRQREKSWYMLLFQFPGVAERWLTEDGWFNFRAWGGHPGADPLADTRPQVVPGQRAARVVGRAAAPAPAGAGPHHGRLEYRRPRPDRGADDRLRRARVRPLAVRAPGGPRPLDAAGCAGPGQRPADGLPAGGKAGVK